MNDKEALLRIIRVEIEKLDKMIQRTESGGWSTHNLQSMKQMRDHLKAVVFDYS